MTDPLVAITDGLYDAFEEGYKQGKADAMTWIPVSERLPIGIVLACGKNGIIEILMYDSERKQWDCFNGYFCPEDWVTHWMPLPEPPKEGE